MARLLDVVLPEYGLDYDAVDVDREPELRRRFGDTVPVLLRDGRPVAKVRVDAGRLRRLVARRRD
jgi:hypothetical protein